MLNSRVRLNIFVNQGNKVRDLGIGNFEDGFFVRSEKTSEQWVIRFRDLGSWVGPTELGLFPFFLFLAKI